MASHELAEKNGIRGRITFTNFLLAGRRATEIDEQLGKARRMPREAYQALLTELGYLCKVRGLMVRNQVVLAARTELAARLIGDADYTGEINYGAVGTGSTAVADSDPALDTEVARALVATTTQTNDAVTVDFYFSKASVSGTFEEFGTFIDGTSSADSGLLFNRALTGGWTKTSLEAMTVSVQLSFDVA